MNDTKKYFICQYIKVDTGEYVTSIEPQIYCAKDLDDLANQIDEYMENNPYEMHVNNFNNKKYKLGIIELVQTNYHEYYI